MALAICNTKTNQQGRELAEHGSALFPIACFDDDLAKNAVPWHWHDELEAIIVAEGVAVVAVDAKKYTVSQGEGFFLNAGVLHAVSDKDSSNCRLHSVVFHPRLVGGSIDSVFWQNYIRPLIENPALKTICFGDTDPRRQEAIQAIDTAWQECAKEQPGYEFRVRSALSQFVFLLSCYHPAAISRPSDKALRDEKRIKRMLEFIQEHYASELSTASIAKSAMISESECLRCFRNTIGASPIQYVKQFRVLKAMELLATTERKIADIGAECGFQDTSYFTKTFRELKECTPTMYRQKSSAPK